MKTAYKLVQERTKDFTQYPTPTLIVSIMDEYSQQQACAFSEYVGKLGYVYYRSIEKWTCPYLSTRTTSELYQQFLQEGGIK